MRIVPIDSIKGAEYNPRVTDRDRLEVIKLSLRKLGFLSPVYAAASGRILSGHQRQLAASELGWDEIPVEIVPDADRHKSLNILFNRATNDLFSNTSTSTGLTVALQQSKVAELAAALPDAENRFPCMDAEIMPIAPFLAANSGRVNQYATSVAGSLRRFGVVLPIVARPSRVVVNGIGRLHSLARDNELSGRFIIISDDAADLAELTMNLLTMDFDIKGKMADEIRFHNFRRARQNPKELGTAYGAATKIRNLAKLEDRREWIAEHGRSVLDFGAGLLTEADMMRPYGIDVTVFEPFVNNGSDGIDVTFSRRVAKEFLAVVASGKAFSSLFLNFVLNSVPFDADRRCILRILNALTGNGKVYVSTKSVTHSNCVGVRNGGYQGGSYSSQLGFGLDYEPNIVMSELSSNFRTQKFFEPKELAGMLGDYWEIVKPLEIGSELRFMCRRAKKLTAESLEAALRFEFDLPYPDGSRMGLADAALEAFAARQKRNS